MKSSRSSSPLNNRILFGRAIKLPILALRAARPLPVVKPSAHRHGPETAGVKDRLADRVVVIAILPGVRMHDEHARHAAHGVEVVVAVVEPADCRPRQRIGTLSLGGPVGCSRRDEEEGENSRAGVIGLKGDDGGRLGSEVKGVATRRVDHSGPFI